MTEMYEIKVGHVLSKIEEIPCSSVDCVVTSPPYYGLRDYGVMGQIGLEKTPLKYIENMVSVFREIRRVLKPEGTVWLNIGDSYAGSGKGRMGDGSCQAKGKQATNKGSTEGVVKRSVTTGFKPKDLLMIPHRLAIALQEDGWWVRQDIVWSKLNPMPNPVKDRCVTSHEYIFLLSKSKKYYFDHEAIKEDAVTDATKKRSKRSVWSASVSPYPEAHFAVYPPQLIEPCILAGCPVGGTVLDPFAGSGTTGGVAERNGRDSILIELNPTYAELIPKRISQLTEAE